MDPCSELPWHSCPHRELPWCGRACFCDTLDDLSSVARQYPPRTDGAGTTWYRPAFDGDTPPKMWGWTSCPEHAHPSYGRIPS